MHGDDDPCQCDYCQMRRRERGESGVWTDGKPIEEQWFYTDSDLVELQSRSYNRGMEVGLTRGFCWGLTLSVCLLAFVMLVSDLSK